MCEEIDLPVCPTHYHAPPPSSSPLSATAWVTDSCSCRYTRLCASSLIAFFEVRRDANAHRPLETPPAPPPLTHFPFFCVDVWCWQRSRADDCIHTSAHSQRSRQPERKLHILSAGVSELVYCSLSSSLSSSKENVAFLCILAGVLTSLHSNMCLYIMPKMLYVLQNQYKLVKQK